VVGRGEVVMLRGELIPVLRLHRLFNVAGAVTAVTEGLLVVVEGNGRRCALLVDELLDQQQVVIKSLGKSLGRLRGVSGGAILADGRVGLVLDPGGIIDLAQTRHAPYETAAGLATTQITGNLADNDAGGTPTQVGLPSGQPGYAR
jgi:two-component system chemotaxis sensor kinase CheA